MSLKLEKEIIMNEDEEYEYIEKRRLEYEKWVKEKSIKLELGKTYLQLSMNWNKKHYKIVFVDDTIAVGIVVWDEIYNSTTRGCGGRELFRVETGEKYQDPRLNYALIKEVH